MVKSGIESSIVANITTEHGGSIAHFVDPALESRPLGRLFELAAVMNKPDTDGKYS